MGELKGLIFDIQGFSVHDGPGCRTLIFLKGCPLKCKWCSNPEGIYPQVQLMYHSAKCVGDMGCQQTCPHGAVSEKNNGGGPDIDRNKCQECETMDCVKACNFGALALSGTWMTIDEVWEKIQRDRQYWGPKGGVTLSGGEPMMQFEFANALLKKCFEAYIHTAMETSGYATGWQYNKVLDHLEWIFFDLKHMDPRKHHEGTGVSNEIILENARIVAKSDKVRVIFRIPLVPGFNDTDENVRATAEFLLSVGRTEVNVLPLHHFGSSKYEMVGRDYNFPNREKPTKKRMEEIRTIFEGLGITCYLGSDTPF